MEWLQLPSWLIYHVGSGHAFFFAQACLLGGFFLFLVGSRKTPVNHPARLIVALGAVVLILSGCPLPWWFYSIWGVSCFGWLWVEENEAKASRRLRIAARLLFAFCWVIALALELPFHRMPMVPVQQHAALTIIGDSVSAGLGDEFDPWPALLAKQQRIEITNLAVAGASVRSAQEQAKQLPEHVGLVFLAIGGNDVLSGTSANQFHVDLDELLKMVCRPGRTVVMLELPLPPLHNSFGIAQRQLASRHGVILLPKRTFIGVLAGPKATVDGIHLLPTGHQQMADAIWGTIGDAFADVRRE